VQAAVAEFACDRPASTLMTTLEEIDELLTLGLDNDEMGAVLEALGSYDIPSLAGQSNAAFLGEIAGVLRAHLAERGEQET